MSRFFALIALLGLSVISLAVEQKPRVARVISSDEPSQQKQASPTLQETADWLKEKLVASAGGTFAPGGMVSDQKYDNFKFEGCTVSFRSILRIKGTPGFEQDTETAFSLSDIDPASVDFFRVEKTSGLLGVSMKTENASDKVSVKTLGRTVGQAVKQTSSVSITIPDEEIARRVAKAFQHSATLCRSRKEAF